MNKHFFLVLVMLPLSLFAQVNDINSEGIGAITKVLQDSGLESGTFVFKKYDIYFEYRYEDSWTSIKILNFPKEKSVFVYLDTISPSFIVAGVHVGMSEAEIRHILGPPVRYIANGDIFEMEYFGKGYGIGYFLIIDIRAGIAERIYHNPFS